MCEGKRSIAEIPELLAQWDWEKNDALGITPEKATRGKVKKVFWICDKGHSFEARIDHRCSMGVNCHYCAGKRPIVGENDVATLYPHLLDEWDNEKNGGKTLEDFVANSNKRVWWKCAKCGESWQTGITHRTSRGSGCPMCARTIRGKSRIATTVQQKGSLLELRPDLAKEWDFKKNTEFAPDKVSAGSNKAVWWKCRKCCFSFKKSIAARSGGNGCPACAGKKVFVGYNDLASLYPELTEEWSSKNNLLPTQVTAGYAGKVWWNCNSCGYEWQAVVYSRTTKGRKGSGCPLCAGKIVIPGLNDFTTTHEEIAKQWDFEKNGELSPSSLRPHSNKKVWWKCEKGHSWSASVGSRARGRGCPVCNGERFTSFPEQAIVYYLSKVTEAKNRFRFQKREIDVFLPELFVGIEYNGFYYHQNRKAQDAEKAEFLRERGMRLICVEEGDCEGTDGDTIYYKYINEKYQTLKSIIEQILKMLSLPSVDVDIDRDRREIYSLYMRQEKENSVAAKRPWLIDEWNYEKNGDLTPWQVSHGSRKHMWWKCPVCSYEWEAVVSSRKDRGCPKCNTRWKRNFSGQEKIEGM